MSATYADGKGRMGPILAGSARERPAEEKVAAARTREGRKEPASAAHAGDVLVANRRRFLSFLERRLGDREAAEELLQAAYVRGVERAGEIRDEESVVPWFYRLLRNAVVDHWRARGAERRAGERLARELGNAHQPAPEVEDELCRCFEAQLGELRPDYAEILRRVDLSSERPTDFANAHGLTANNAMVRLHRARRALRERLLVLCGVCAEHGCLHCSCRSSHRRL